MSTVLRRRSPDLIEELDHVLHGRGVLDGLRRMRRLREAATNHDPDRAAELLIGAAEGYESDPLAAYLALHAGSDVPSRLIDDALIDLIEVDHPGIREHATWALSRRPPSVRAFPRLIRLSESGGFLQMLAELSLEKLLRQTPGLLESDVVNNSPAGSRLRWLATQQEEPRPGIRTTKGLRIAQVLMQGRIDADLTAAAAGDGGGLTTLQVGLTRSLADHDSVGAAYLIARRIDEGDGRFAKSRERVGSKGTIARLDFGPRRYLSAADLWPWRADLERALRRLLIAEGPFDGLHLRFADAGTLAAARAARILGIPVYFTLAPDPHGPIAAAEQLGNLHRGNFAQADLEQHYVFRVWLLDWMVEHAQRLALLPRRNQTGQFRHLLGLDIAEDPDRFRPIAEGVDFDITRKAADHVRGVHDGLPVDGALQALRRSLDRLPAERRTLPLIISVGRLHSVKGFDRLVRAWWGDPDLNASYNLVIVGGNLDDPSDEERLTLTAIMSSLEGLSASEAGLIMLGNQVHNDVAVLLAAAVRGVPGMNAPHGVYACSSDKEEFGLAIVEALAAGLPVVAPRVGGPATYVDHGFIGYLADTLSVEDLRRGLRWADRARVSDLRADAAARLVEKGYSLGAMADELVDFYTFEPAEAAAG